MKKILTALLGMTLLLSCTPTPRPIDYGSDMCAYCKMTIVSEKHSAEVVTQKGKVFKFDAIECMINYFLEQKNETDFAHLLVKNYLGGSEWIDARSSHFLISKAVPSPMGAYLSAFEKEKDARGMASEKGGTTFTWESLLKYMKEEGMVFER